MARQGISRQGIWRIGAVMAAWLLLCGVKGWPAPPPDLMPRHGRSQAFGAGAVLLLLEADHARPVPFGSRPPTVRNGDDWQLLLRWRAGGYDLFDPAAPADPPGGRLALRPLPGRPALFIVQTLWAEDAEFSYRLAIRLPDGAFVYFHDNAECEALAPAALARILPDARDRAACRARNWRQVEALVAAYANTGPQPFGVATAVPPA